MPGAEFNAAKDKVENLKSKPTNDELLQLYALFKQAMQDPKFEDAPKPGMLDLKGKAKRSQWQKVVDAGTTPQEAETQYVALVNELIEKYGINE